MANLGNCGHLGVKTFGGFKSGLTAVLLAQLMALARSLKRAASLTGKPRIFSVTTLIQLLQQQPGVILLGQFPETVIKR